MLEAEAENAEDDGEESEADYLERLAAEGVDGDDGGPMARQRAGADKDDGADCLIVESVVESISVCIPDSMQNNSVIQSKTVESQILIAR